MPRLFVGVWPPEALVAELLAIPRPRIEGLRWTRPEQWHVTLDFLGSIHLGEVPRIAEALESALTSVDGTVEAVAGPAPTSLSPRVWALPVTGLETLAGTLRSSVSRLHTVTRSDGPFRGHLTLARTNRRAGPRLLSELDSPALDCHWNVHEVCLVSSSTEPEGAVYEVVERWTLPA